MEQKSVFYPIFLPAIPSKNFLQKYEKYSKPKAVLMFLFQLWMVAYLVVPRIPSIPSSSHPLTEIHPDWLSGCIISKNIDKFKRVDVVRLVASLSDGCARLGTVVIGGMDFRWDEGLGTLRLLGSMGEAGSIIHIKNSVLNFRSVFMARPVRLRTRRFPCYAATTSRRRLLCA